MPLYEYQCEACGKRFEAFEEGTQKRLSTTCTMCGKGPVRQLLSSPAIQFKGSGWYITDYAKKDRGGESSETGQADCRKSRRRKSRDREIRRRKSRTGKVRHREVRHRERRKEVRDHVRRRIDQERHVIASPHVHVPRRRRTRTNESGRAG